MPSGCPNTPEDSEVPYIEYSFLVIYFKFKFKLFINDDIIITIIIIY